MPRAIIIAGPNGAGKTTFAFEFLPAEGNCPTFFNADLIAAGLAPFRPETAAVAASRLMLEHIRRAAAERRDFAIETTLAGRAYLRMIREWQAAGYHVDLVFLALPSLELAIARVCQRVAQGGHDIPEADIRRRFDRGLVKLREVYQGIVNAWQVHDASQWPPGFVDEGAIAMDRQPPSRNIERSSAPMIRAARRAAGVARQHKQPLVLWRDGRVAHVMPDDLPPLPDEAPRQTR